MRTVYLKRGQRADRDYLASLLPEFDINDRQVQMVRDLRRVWKGRLYMRIPDEGEEDARDFFGCSSRYDGGSVISFYATLSLDDASNIYVLQSYLAIQMKTAYPWPWSRFVGDKEERLIFDASTIPTKPQAVDMKHNLALSVRLNSRKRTNQVTPEVIDRYRTAFVA